MSVMWIDMIDHRQNYVNSIDLQKPMKNRGPLDVIAFTEKSKIPMYRFKIENEKFDLQANFQNYAILWGTRSWLIFWQIHVYYHQWSCVVITDVFFGHCHLPQNVKMWSAFTDRHLYVIWNMSLSWNIYIYRLVLKLSKTPPALSVGHCR